MIEDITIPSSWRWAQFSDVARVASDLVDPTLTPNAFHIAPNHIESRTGKLLPYTTVASDKVTSPKHRFHSGQILYSKIRPYLAKAVQVYFEGVCSADMYPVDALIDSTYLFHWLLSPWFTAQTSQNQGRTILPKINQVALGRMPVPVPPIREQSRIAAKIEELFSDLDAGVAALKRAKANLKRYRAAVLKSAVEGKLTEQWRAKHPNTEPAAKLLERILVERRKKWAADQLSKFAASKKEPPKNWKAKYVEPSPPDKSGLPELPEGWCWASVEQVAEFTRYGSSAKTNEDNVGVPVLRMGNIIDGQLDFHEMKYLPRNHPEFPDLLLNQSDLLFNRTNSAELVGKAAIYEGQHDPCSFASYLIAVRCLTGCNSRFLCTYINSAHGRRWVKSVVSQQVGQANVNGTKLQALVFPFPSFPEQQQIVNEVAEKLSQIDVAVVAIGHTLLRAARLRQSILKQAFEGKLVPQDPKDEPASVSLERIKASQPTTSNGKPRVVRQKRTKQEAT